MSYLFTFHLDAEMAPLLLVMTVAYECDLSIGWDSPFPSVVGRGILGQAMEPSPLGQEIIRDAFGVETKSTLVIRFVGPGDSMATLTTICTSILKQMNCDLVLLANGEKPYVLRKGGDIFVDCQPTDPQYSPRWLGLALNEAGVAFETRALKML